MEYSGYRYRYIKQRQHASHNISLQSFSRPNQRYFNFTNISHPILDQYYFVDPNKTGDLLYIKHLKMSSGFVTGSSLFSKCKLLIKEFIIADNTLDNSNESHCLVLINRQITIGNAFACFVDAHSVEMPDETFIVRQFNHYLSTKKTFVYRTENGGLIQRGINLNLLSNAIKLII